MFARTKKILALLLAIAMIISILPEHMTSADVEGEGKVEYVTPTSPIMCDMLWVKYYNPNNSSKSIEKYAWDVRGFSYLCGSKDGYYNFTHTSTEEWFSLSYWHNDKDSTLDKKARNGLVEILDATYPDWYKEGTGTASKDKLTYQVKMYGKVAVEFYDTNKNGREVFFYEPGSYSIGYFKEYGSYELIETYMKYDMSEYAITSRSDFISICDKIVWDNKPDRKTRITYTYYPATGSNPPYYVSHADTNFNWSEDMQNKLNQRYGGTISQSIALDAPKIKVMATNCIECAKAGIANGDAKPSTCTNKKHTTNFVLETFDSSVNTGLFKVNITGNGTTHYGVSYKNGGNIPYTDSNGTDTTILFKSTNPFPSSITFADGMSRNIASSQSDFSKKYPTSGDGYTIQNWLSNSKKIDDERIKFVVYEDEPTDMQYKVVAEITKGDQKAEVVVQDYTTIKDSDFDSKKTFSYTTDDIFSNLSFGVSADEAKNATVGDVTFTIEEVDGKPVGAPLSGSTGSGTLKSKNKKYNLTTEGTLGKYQAKSKILVKVPITIPPSENGSIRVYPVTDTSSKSNAASSVIDNNPIITVDPWVETAGPSTVPATITVNGKTYEYDKAWRRGDNAGSGSGAKGITIDKNAGTMTVTETHTEAAVLYAQYKLKENTSYVHVYAVNGTSPNKDHEIGTVERVADNSVPFSKNYDFGDGDIWEFSDYKIGSNNVGQQGDTVKVNYSGNSGTVDVKTTKNGNVDVYIFYKKAAGIGQVDVKFRIPKDSGSGTKHVKDSEGSDIMATISGASGTPYTAPSTYTSPDGTVYIFSQIKGGTLSTGLGSSYWSATGQNFKLSKDVPVASPHYYINVDFVLSGANVYIEPVDKDNKSIGDPVVFPYKSTESREAPDVDDYKFVEFKNIPSNSGLQPVNKRLNSTKDGTSDIHVQAVYEKDITDGAKHINIIPKLEDDTPIPGVNVPSIDNKKSKTGEAPATINARYTFLRFEDNVPSNVSISGNTITVDADGTQNENIVAYYDGPSPTDPPQNPGGSGNTGGDVTMPSFSDEEDQNPGSGGSSVTRADTWGNWDTDIAIPFDQNGTWDASGINVTFNPVINQDKDLVGKSGKMTECKNDSGTDPCGYIYHDTYSISDAIPSGTSDVKGAVKVHPFIAAADYNHYSASASWHVTRNVKAEVIGYEITQAWTLNPVASYTGHHYDWVDFDTTRRLEEDETLSDEEISWGYYVTNGNEVWLRYDNGTDYTHYEYVYTPPVVETVTRESDYTVGYDYYSSGTYIADINLSVANFNGATLTNESLNSTLNVPKYNMRDTRASNGSFYVPQIRTYYDDSDLTPYRVTLPFNISYPTITVPGYDDDNSSQMQAAQEAAMAAQRTLTEFEERVWNLDKQISDYAEALITPENLKTNFGKPRLLYEGTDENGRPIPVGGDPQIGIFSGSITVDGTTYVTGTYSKTNLTLKYIPFSSSDTSRIVEKILNDRYSGIYNITYAYTNGYNKKSSTPLPGKTNPTNTVFVHTPVAINVYADFGDNSKYNQTKTNYGTNILINGMSESYASNKAENNTNDFTLRVDNKSTHLGIADFPGYGEKDYRQYVISTSALRNADNTFGSLGFDKKRTGNEVCFTCDMWVDVGNNNVISDDILIPANTWWAIEATNDSSVTVGNTTGAWGGTAQRFYLPEWVADGEYKYTVRAIAYNNPDADVTYAAMTASSQTYAEGRVNTNQTLKAAPHGQAAAYIATANGTFRVLGKLYGLTLFNSNDEIDWADVFRKGTSVKFSEMIRKNNFLALRRSAATSNLADYTNASNADKTKFNKNGVYYYTYGTNNELGIATGRQSWATLPVVYGDSPSLAKTGVMKAGYKWGFKVKTQGSVMAENGATLKIEPSFYWVDNKGQNRTAVNLFYTEKNAGKQYTLTKVGSTTDSKNVKKSTADSIDAGIPALELLNTAGIKEFSTVKEWGGVNSPFYKYSTFTIDQHFKTFSNLNYLNDTKSRALARKYNAYGEDSAPVRAKLLAYLSNEKYTDADETAKKVSMLEQTYYFNYSIPTEFYAAPTTVSPKNLKELKALDCNKGGYLIVNFKITAVDKDGTEYLWYDGGQNSMWRIETGLATGNLTKTDAYNKTFTFQPGDTLLLSMTRTAADDNSTVLK